MWLSPTFNGVSTRFQSEAIPVLRHSSAHDQWWEHPDDSLITSGSCETACADSPASSYVGAERPQSYADAKYACESFNGCNSQWVETQQVIDNSGNLWDLSTSRPQRLPRGWRVDSAGHWIGCHFCYGLRTGCSHYPPCGNAVEHYHALRFLYRCRRLSIF
jgi:hypothetical protein